MNDFQIAEKKCELLFNQFAQNMNTTTQELISKIKYTPVEKKYDVYFFSGVTPFIGELKNISKEYSNYGIEEDKYLALKKLFTLHNISPLYILFLPNGKTKVVQLELMFANENKLQTKFWNCPKKTLENCGTQNKKFFILEEKYLTNYQF